MRSLRTALHYAEEGHWSRISGECWNMIGWEWDSCPVEVYTIVKSPPVENFAYGWKMTWLPTWQHFLKRSSPKVKFLGQSQSLEQETWLLENFNSKAFFYCLYIFSNLPSLASYNHVLGWNSWPTGALLHRSVKQLLVLMNLIEKLVHTFWYPLK
jgi:hypothetical protein